MHSDVKCMWMALYTKFHLLVLIQVNTMAHPLLWDPDGLPTGSGFRKASGLRSSWPLGFYCPVATRPQTSWGSSRQASGPGPGRGQWAWPKSRYRQSPWTKPADEMGAGPSRPCWAWSKPPRMKAGEKGAGRGWRWAWPRLPRAFEGAVHLFCCGETARAKGGGSCWTRNRCMVGWVKQAPVISPVVTPSLVTTEPEL